MSVRDRGNTWLFLLPLAFASAALLARVLLWGAPLSIAADLAQPLPVATTWHDFGRTLMLMCFGCVLIAAIPYYKVLVAILRQAAEPSLRRIVGICALTLAAALTMPVIFSSDVYAYGAYGLMDSHGVSPYVHASLAIRDPLVGAAIWQWRNPLPVCVYGPLFVWIAKVCVLGTAQFGVWAQLLALRILACTAFLICGLLIYVALAGLRCEQRLAGVAGVLLNPVAIWTVAEGHNDALMLMFVLLGFIAIRRFGLFVGAFIIASSALIKASGLAAAVVLAVFSWSSRGRFVQVLAGIAAGIALTGILTLPFDAGMRTLLVPHAQYTPQFSAQFLIAQILTTIYRNHFHALELGVAVAVVSCGVLMMHGVRLAVKGESEGAAYIALGLWFLIPNPYPWYALWILPVAFLCMRTRAALAIVAASVTIFVRYLPETSSATNPDLNVVVTLCALALPIAILSTQMRSEPRKAALESDTTA